MSKDRVELRSVWDHMKGILDVHEFVTSQAGVVYENSPRGRLSVYSHEDDEVKVMLLGTDV